ncbi:hypothetical protein LTR53_004625 [Teratosphaeriaceae sp. CCFEE 6253]|nr:hypothetical protein LTR53_004625 [Teratosphaeriaceae sp. CCFEE 6253]
MAPKKTATKAAATANSSAKVTKPAPAKTKSTKTDTAKKASAKKAPATATRATPKRAAAQPKTVTAAPAKAAVTKKAAAKKTAPAPTSAPRGTKRKAEDDAEEPPAKKRADTKMVAAAKKPATKKTTTTKKTAAATKKPAAAPKKPAAAPKKPAAAPKKIAAAKKVTATKKTTKRKVETDAPGPAADAEAPKKAAPTSKKRKTEDAGSAAPVKKIKQVKTLKKGAVINEPPTQPLKVFVFGEGSAGELGLGTAKNTIDVKRPRLNPYLAADKVGVVQIVAGGMHVIALTKDNKILTWGVNDQGALGRDTTWGGGLKDMDAGAADNNSDDGDEDNNGLNPKECIPAEVDFSSADMADDTRWVEVAAGDSCSFALTDDGRVYGWGTFRANEGVLGFNPETEIAYFPILNPDLKKITHITAGANHALALDNNGAVFAWGSGQQNQLGRRIVERTKLEGLRAREFGLPKGPKKGIVAIESGAYHSFAIDRNGSVYSWGLNTFGQTGFVDNAGDEDATVLKPQVIEALKGKTITSIKGGAQHSICATSDGDCLAWGRAGCYQMGLASSFIANLGPEIMEYNEHGRPAMIKIPQKVTAIEGAVTQVATNSDHAIVVTKEGKAWSWGFSANYQTGQGFMDEVEEAAMIDNSATRDQQLVGATAGGQFGIVTAIA